VKQSRLARLARKAYAHCQRNGWSRDWREAGCYLHLEASEFTEALRGKACCRVGVRAVGHVRWRLHQVRRLPAGALLQERDVCPRES